MSALLHLGKSITFVILWVECFSHPWTYQMSYVFPPALFPLILYTFPIEHVTGQFRLSVLDAPYWMEAP